MGSLARARLAGALCVPVLLGAGCGGEQEGEGETATVSPASTMSSTATQATTTAPEEPEIPAPGSDEPTGEDQAPLSERDVIAAVLTVDGDPRATCGELVTEEFVRTAYGDRSGCLAARKPRALARSIEFEQLAQTETMGTARVIPTGGPYDGIEVRVEFESADGFGPPWRVTALEADVPAGP